MTDRPHKKGDVWARHSGESMVTLDVDPARPWVRVRVTWPNGRVESLGWCAISSLEKDRWVRKPKS